MKEESGVAGGQKHCPRSARAYVKITTEVKSCEIAPFLVLVCLFNEVRIHEFEQARRGDTAHKI